VEPFPGVEPGSASIPRTRGCRSEGRELAGLESNQRRHMVQSHGAPADRATGHWSPRRVPPSASRSYKDRPVIGPGGEVRSAGVEPASTWPSTRPVYQIAARAHGASGRSRTACLSLTRGPLCRVSYRGMGYRGWNRTSVPLGQGQGGMPATHPVSRAEGASRTRKPRGLSSRGMPDSRHSRMVRRQGLEPRAFGLRIRCSNH
jgi:hypothetical protein